MLTVRRIAFVVGVALLIVLGAMFAYSNPALIDVDVGLARFERVSMAGVFAVVFAFGWVSGVLSVALALWHSAGEKRRLRQDLEFVQAELRAARKQP